MKIILVLLGGSAQFRKWLHKLESQLLQKVLNHLLFPIVLKCPSKGKIPHCRQVQIVYVLGILCWVQCDRAPGCWYTKEPGHTKQPGRLLPFDHPQCDEVDISEQISPTSFNSLERPLQLVLLTPWGFRCPINSFISTIHTLCWTTLVQKASPL